MTTAATSPFATRVSDALTPRPFRGDLLAAGAVVLAVGVLLAVARFGDAWAAGARFAVVTPCAALVLGLGWLAPREGPTPRAYASVLFVAGFALLVVALSALADALGGSSNSAGTATWVGLLVAAKFAVLARARNSAVCTLLAAGAAVLTLLAFVAWAFDPDGSSTFRWLLLVAILALVAGVLRLRDAHRRHAVALVDVAALSALAIALTALAGALGSVFGGTGGSPALGTGWELVLLVCGCGLAAYSAVDHEPGPGYLGFFVLLAFVLVAQRGDSLIGWPVLLALLGGGVMAAALRPTTPAPAAPDADHAPAPTRPMPRVERLFSRADRPTEPLRPVDAPTEPTRPLDPPTEPTPPVSPPDRPPADDDVPDRSSPS